MLVAAAAANAAVAAVAKSDPDDFTRATARNAPPGPAFATASRPAHAAGPVRAYPRRVRSPNIYADTVAGRLTSVTRRARYLVYVPDSQGNGVYVSIPAATG
jgi:hypothetical protein